MKAAFKLASVPLLILAILAGLTYPSQKSLTQHISAQRQTNRQQQVMRIKRVLSQAIDQRLALAEKVLRSAAVEQLSVSNKLDDLKKSLPQWQQGLSLGVLAVFDRESNTLLLSNTPSSSGQFFGLADWVAEQLSEDVDGSAKDSIALFQGYPSYLRGVALDIAGETRLLFIIGFRFNDTWLKQLARASASQLILTRTDGLRLESSPTKPNAELVNIQLPPLIRKNGYKLQAVYHTARMSEWQQFWPLWSLGLIIASAIGILTWLVFQALGQTRSLERLANLATTPEELAKIPLPVPLDRAARLIADAQFANLDKIEKFEHKLKQTIQSLSNAKRQLSQIQAEKNQLQNAPKTRAGFLSRMGDEITTPMKSVSSMLKLLGEFDFAEEPRELLGIAIRSQHMLSSNIENVLDFNKLDAGLLKLFPANFDISVMVKELVTDLIPHATAKGLKLEWNVNDRVTDSCFGDRQRISQILYNLAGNAIRFTKDGSIGIYVDTLYEKGRQLVRFTVADTGIGIPRQAQKAVFESLEQRSKLTNSSFTGRLRLIVSKQLAALMGGQIGVSSEAGKGSRFWFTIRYQRPQP